MANRRHLIIGCGAAAFAAGKAVRRLEPNDEILMFTRENHLPYSIAALPYLISGKIGDDGLWLADDDYLRKMGFSLIKGKEVTEIQPQHKQVVCRDGSQEGYDTLLIASGSKPVIPDIKGLDETGFVTFHTLDDCHRLQQKLTDRHDVVIYGGGLIAIELAVALLEAGHRVTLIVRSRVLRRYFDEDAGNLIEGILSSRGAHIYRDSQIGEVREKQGKKEIHLLNGKSVNTDIIAVALGVRPSVSFLEGSGINIGDGVLVDSKMKTNLEDVYAAGDVAESPNFYTGNPGVNPIWPSAVDQGAVAAQNMAGREVSYDGWLPMNVLSFFGHRAVSIGVLEGEGCEVLKAVSPEKKEYRKLVLKDNRLVGASFLNVELFPGVIQYLIRKRLDIGQYAELLLQKPKNMGTMFMLKEENRETLSLEV